MTEDVDLVVTVNGEQERLSAGMSVADLVGRLAGGGRGTAVARNGEVVPRSRWPVTVLHPHDVVEILTAAQGG
ncbi:MAG TPA: sulfur carrier protein ThiS [Acidimicrobiales bacterium]|nr:sulfur carrier protein ThiS [Acidimicrobiales bacterium]